MAEVHGWDRLLSDSFFQQESGELSIEDARRLLEIIGEESIRTDQGTPCISQDRAETVGFKAYRAKEELGHLAEVADPSAESGEMKKFLVDKSYQGRVLGLMDFLIKRLNSNLPVMEQLSKGTLSKMKARRDSTNAQELEKEVAKAEAARLSAEDAKAAAEEAREAAKDAKTTADAAELASTSAKETADSIMPNMLTTLGVFIAIVIAVVACYLSVLLSQHTGTDSGQPAAPLHLVTILLMGHILLNIIFLLLYPISKMSAHTLACHCQVGDQMDCQECNRELRGQCHLRHKLWLRYPYVVAINGAFVTAYCALGLWHLLQHYFGASIDLVLKENWVYAVIVVGLTTVLIIGAGIFFFHFFLRSPRQRLDAAQRRTTAKEQRTSRKKQKKESERKVIHNLCANAARQDEEIVQLKNELAALNKKLGDLASTEEHTTV